MGDQNGAQAMSCQHPITAPVRQAAYDGADEIPLPVTNLPFDLMKARQNCNDFYHNH